ncbi:response regulator [candidate division CSSED10-310 bacterium]|uniref:histidine kinase n=1 Tax=candidate division CSSED10-310 bacterium TaxID=2855610 RepID=A0ABV6YTI3_UNCC1
MEDLTKEEFTELFSAFRAEIQLQTTQVSKDLLYLEKKPRAKDKEEIFNRIMREAHNVKGAARIVDLPEVSEIAQNFESVVGAVKEEKIELTRDLFDLLHFAMDTVLKAIEHRIRGNILDVSDIATKLNIVSEAGTVAIADLSSAAEIESVDQESEESAPAETIQLEEKIFISTKRIDVLMDWVGELLISKLKNEQRLSEFIAIQHELENALQEQGDVQAVLSKITRTIPDTDVVFLMKLYQDLKATLIEQGNMLRAVVKGYQQDARHLSLVADFLHQSIKKTRMLPISTIFDTFEKMVRDLSRKQQKKVNMVVKGRATELDRQILEKIRDPLMHIIRNAIDHGLETPDQRTSAQKPEQGTIILEAMQRGNAIFIIIRDDGAGIDREKIIGNAIKKNLITPEEAALLEGDLAYSLIFRPGFSTKEIVTDISGRGFGMDVAKKNVEDLQGMITIQSEKNKGTEISIQIPLTLATLKILLISVAGEVIAIPSMAINKILKIKSEDIITLEGRTVIQIDQEPIALAWLKDILKLPGKGQIKRDKAELFCVLLSFSGGKGAFIVDEVQGEQDVVIKKLGEADSRIKCLSGATILSTGKVVIIVNPAELIQLTRGRSITTYLKPLEEKIAPKRILVIDDSITTRNFEKAVLTGAGYEVVSATNGEEGLAIIRQDSFDLVVSDIQMPKIDGLQFTEQVKRDPTLSATPVILISSLESKDEIARGLEVGADAYITKQTFSRQTLLETVQRFI